MLGVWFGLDKEILFKELMSSFSKDNQKLQVSLISQLITQHLSPAMGLLVFWRFILFISNPLWLISSIKEGIKWTLTNSWKGFFSIGSSFLGFGIFLTGISFPFFMSTLGAELFWEIELFPLISSTSDLCSFISSEFDLEVF